MTDGWMERMDTWLNKQMNKEPSNLMHNGRMSAWCMEGWMNGWIQRMNNQMNKQDVHNRQVHDGWMDGKNEQMSEWINELGEHAWSDSGRQWIK